MVQRRLLGHLLLGFVICLGHLLEVFEGAPAAGRAGQSSGQGCLLAELERCVPLRTKSATGCTCAANLNCL